MPYEFVDFVYLSSDYNKPRITYIWRSKIYKNNKMVNIFFIFFIFLCSKLCFKPLSILTYYILMWN